jgi:hypothetical protein
MKRELPIIIVSVLFMLLTFESSAQIDTICQGGSTTVMNGEYNVMNNVWGSGSGVGQQCIVVDMDTSYFKVSLSTHNSSQVASYPTIFKGCHWGWCTTSNNPMPLQVNKIDSAPFTWTVNTENIPGTWNAALDIWFDDLSSFGNDYDAELMIWIDYNGGAGPAGSYQATIEIGGLSWDVYFAGWDSWNYIAYKITEPVDSVSLDLKDFMEDALARGYLFTPWYLHAIEAGFEIWSGGQGLTTNSFSTGVIETSSPINYPPASFALQFPGDNATMNDPSIRFRWQDSNDPDLENIEYILNLFGPEGDTTVAGIVDTDRYTFNGSGYFQPGASYTWFMEATDGKDTTISSTERSFTISSTVDVDLVSQGPDKFFLYQNFPNPFNPTTKISYTLKSSGKVRLSILDLLGREVKVLLNDVINKGLYEVEFSGTDLPSGIYFYRLQSADGIITKKMTLLK